MGRRIGEGKGIRRGEGKGEGEVVRTDVVLEVRGCGGEGGGGKGGVTLWR